MDQYRDLLSRPHLSVISADADYELDRIAGIITASVRVSGRGDLEVLLGRLLDAADGAAVACKTLDLIGHSTAHGCQLRLGDWVVDASSPTVTAFFRGLTDHDVLPRLGIESVRLLGCKTADTTPGRATICRLASVLGVEVYGSNHLLYDAHYDGDGFRDCWQFLLAGASELSPTRSECEVVPGATPWPRMLDVDALPAAPIDWHGGQLPICIASPAAAHRLLRLIRRDAGARMAGLLATPTCQIALPSLVPGTYHTAHVLLDGEFLRFYPEGAVGPGVVYPVDDACALRQIVEELLRATTARSVRSASPS